MKKLFDVIFLEEALQFLESLENKHSEKILYNVRKAQHFIDPELFKKLDSEIWEFRTLFQGKQYRLLAFWDKNDNKNTLVVTTHGIIKKQSKMSPIEIKKANQIRLKFLDEMKKEKGKNENIFN